MVKMMMDGSSWVREPDAKKMFFCCRKIKKITIVIGGTVPRPMHRTISIMFDWLRPGSASIRRKARSFEVVPSRRTHVDLISEPLETVPSS